MATLQVILFLALLSLGSAFTRFNTCYGNIRESTESNTRRIESLEGKVEVLEDSVSALEDMPTAATSGGGGGGGGVVYTRWGSRSCPSITGTELVYVGRTAGPRASSPGGGSNYLCMPEDPEFTLETEDGHQGNSVLDGIEYRNLIPSTGGTNIADVACSVCAATTRSMHLMIPAKTTCPSGWTEEYQGYLMSESTSAYRTSYICVDESLEFTPDTLGGTTAGYLYHVEPSCNQAGLSCGEGLYRGFLELTCVVCTK